MGQSGQWTLNKTIGTVSGFLRRTEARPHSSEESVSTDLQSNSNHWFTSVVRFWLKTSGQWESVDFKFRVPQSWSRQSSALWSADWREQGLTDSFGPASRRVWTHLQCPLIPSIYGTGRPGIEPRIGRASGPSAVGVRSLPRAQVGEERAVPGTRRESPRRVRRGNLGRVRSATPLTLLTQIHSSGESTSK